MKVRVKDGHTIWRRADAKGRQLIGYVGGEIIDLPANSAKFFADKVELVEEAITEGHMDAPEVEEPEVAETAEEPAGEAEAADPYKETGEEPEGPDNEPESPEWPFKTPPDAYLKRYGPDAKNSALARRVLEAEAA